MKNKTIQKVISSGSFGNHVLYVINISPVKKEISLVNMYSVSACNENAPINASSERYFYCKTRGKSLVERKRIEYLCKQYACTGLKFEYLFDEKNVFHLLIPFSQPVLDNQISGKFIMFHWQMLRELFFLDSRTTIIVESIIRKMNKMHKFGSSMQKFMTAFHMLPLGIRLSWSRAWQILPTSDIVNYFLGRNNYISSISSLQTKERRSLFSPNPLLSQRYIHLTQSPKILSNGEINVFYQKHYYVNSEINDKKLLELLKIAKEAWKIG